MKKRFSLSAVASLLLALGGCGGGGVTSAPISSDPAAVVPLPAPTPAPAVLAPTTQAVIAPAYIASSQPLSS